MSGKIWTEEMVSDLKTLRVMSDFTYAKAAEMLNMTHGGSISKEAVRKKIQRIRAEDANAA